MARLGQVNLGRVRGFDGTDGISPAVTVKTDTLTEYILHIEDAARAFDTPNLRGATFKTHVVEVIGHEPLIVPFEDLGLSPERDYLFYPSAGIDYPNLRNIVAIRVDNTVRVSVYYDTVPYTSPQQGSPFDGGFPLIGEPGTYIGDGHIGEQLDGEPFAVNILCVEIAEKPE
jgi:hypothetical protein